MAFEHTFLVIPGLWSTQGMYYDDAGRASPCEGQTVIIHGPGGWLNQGTLRILGDPPVEFQNHYEIVPLEAGRDATTWRSFNPALEDLSGHFILVDDTIISPWRSASGRFWGTEFLVQVSPDEYRGRGCAFWEDRKVSSWAVTLLRGR